MPRDENSMGLSDVARVTAGVIRTKSTDAVRSSVGAGSGGTPWDEETHTLPAAVSCSGQDQSDTMTRTNRSGSSIWGVWPEPSNSTNRAPSLSADDCAATTSRFWSCWPKMNRVRTSAATRKSGTPPSIDRDCCMRVSAEWRHASRNRNRRSVLVRRTPHVETTGPKISGRAPRAAKDAIRVRRRRGGALNYQRGRRGAGHGGQRHCDAAAHGMAHHRPPSPSSQLMHECRQEFGGTIKTEAIVRGSVSGPRKIGSEAVNRLARKAPKNGKPGVLRRGETVDEQGRFAAQSCMDPGKVTPEDLRNAVLQGTFVGDVFAWATKAIHCDFPSAHAGVGYGLDHRPET